MNKTDLSQLTREEFNTLFPVRLVEHDPQWATIFEKERQLILANVDYKLLLRIEHFGSTSIPGIMAKPYVDMIIEIPKEQLFDEDLIEQFKPIGYTHYKVPAREDIEAYMSFGKGYHLDGRKAQIFHIHMCPAENVMWQQIRFRDYLRSHPERARAYESLKLDLAKQYSNDRGAYVLGKTEFVRETLKLVMDQR